MITSLRFFCGSAIMLLSVNAGFSQIKGDPKMQGKMQQLNIPKTSSKLSPALISLHEKSVPGFQNRANPNSIPDAMQNYMQVKGDKVLVDFTAKDDVNVTKTSLEKMGVRITGVYGRVISGYVPVTLLPQLETVSSLRYVKPAYKPMHQPLKTPAALLQNGKGGSQPGDSKSGKVISQGDTAQYSYLARKKYHTDGDGVKVGVLSDSYDNLQTASIGVKDGELPGKGNPDKFKRPVQVISDLDSNGTDEGRAMLEIIHDVAPAADLAFYSAFNGEADFAQGIQTLAKKGCSVICDDIFYFDEPFFQDGIIAQSVDVAKKKGVTYFSAAGNQGISSYENTYHPSKYEPFGADYGTAHNFSGPGDAPRYYQPLYIPAGGNITMSFQWDQSSFAASGVGATSDFDIYLTDIYGNIVAVGGSDNIVSGEPIELLGYFNFTNNYTFFLTIVKYAGPDPKFLKYVMYNDAQFYLTDPAIPGILAPTLVGHAKAEGAIATGAAWYLNTPAYGLDTPYVDYYSSEGGVANYFDINGNRIAPVVRKKPNIVAPDGANTSFFDPFGGGDIRQDADSYPNFFGTSAAAPHAAGVAALMIDAERLNNITPDQIKGILSATAVDMDDINYTDYFDKGFDFNTGYGLINAYKAVGKVKFPNLYVKNLNLKAICSDDPSSVRKWKIVNPNPFPVEVNWFLKGSDQHGCINAQEGETFFSTNTIKSSNCPVANLVILSWKDNFEFTRFDLAYSTMAKCGRDEISARNSDQSITNKPKTTIITDEVNENLAEIFPNPSTKTFNLYLALATDKPVNVDVYSIEGKKLLSKKVNQQKGVVAIDAGNFIPGVYLVNIKQGIFTKTIKVIKQ